MTVNILILTINHKFWPWILLWTFFFLQSQSDFVECSGQESRCSQDTECWSVTIAPSPLSCSTSKIFRITLVFPLSTACNLLFSPREKTCGYAQLPTIPSMKLLDVPPWREWRLMESVSRVRPLLHHLWSVWHRGYPDPWTPCYVSTDL